MSPTLIILCSVIGLTSGVGVLPDSVTAAVGDSVTFSTSLVPAPTPFVSTWSFKGANIITYSAPSDVVDERYRERITLSILTGSLELRDLALSDAGVYSVTIKPAGGGAPKTGSIILNVYERVTNVNATATDTDLLEFNDTVTLSCSASGSALTFLWFNGSAELKASDRVKITNGGATVTIDPVLRYDQGNFSCKVSDAVSSITSDPVPLSVSYGPDFVNLESIPSHQHHVPGSSIYLDCLTESRPPAQISWFLDDQKLSSSAVTLLLLYVTPKDSGNYRCEVYNSKTQRRLLSQPAPINVWEQIQNPLIMASALQLEGASVNLTCNASGSILTREWRVNGAVVKPSENIVFYDANAVLSFKKLTRKDEGYYTCNISNPVNNAIADYSMKTIYGPEHIGIFYSPEVAEGETLTLTCLAESGPAPLYIWSKNGTYLVQSDQYVKENIRVSDSGEYLCTATNEITMTTAQISVKVVVEPKGGLSGGAIAGITIATLVVVAGVVAGGFYFCR